MNLQPAATSVAATAATKPHAAPTIATSSPPPEQTQPDPDADPAPKKRKLSESLLPDATATAALLTNDPDEGPLLPLAPDHSPRSDLALSLDLHDLDSYSVSHYWDASTMAPLNAASAVSIA
jgi:hypothetical protein